MNTKIDEAVLKKNRTVLSEFEFPPNTDKRKIEDFYLYVNHLKFSRKEAKIPYKGFNEKINRIRKYIIQLIFEDLDLDTRDKILKRNRIHFYEKEDFNLIRKENGYTKNVVGFYSSTNFNIHICPFNSDGEYESEGKLLKTLCHELVHGLTYKFIAFKNYDVRLLRFGFSIRTDPQKYVVIEESLIETTVQQSIKRFWYEDPLLKNFALEANSNSTYLKERVLLDAIVQYVATNFTIPYMDIFRLIQRDFILGTEDFFSLFITLFSQEKAGEIFSIKPEELSIDQLNHYLQLLGSDKYFTDAMEINYQDYLERLV